MTSNNYATLFARAWYGDEEQKLNFPEWLGDSNALALRCIEVIGSRDSSRI